jgi:hypothetical protein
VTGPKVEPFGRGFPVRRWRRPGRGLWDGQRPTPVRYWCCSGASTRGDALDGRNADAKLPGNGLDADALGA